MNDNIVIINTMEELLTHLQQYSTFACNTYQTDDRGGCAVDAYTMCDKVYIDDTNTLVFVSNDNQNEFAILAEFDSAEFIKKASTSRNPTRFNLKLKGKKAPTTIRVW